MAARQVVEAHPPRAGGGVVSRPRNVDCLVLDVEEVGGRRASPRVGGYRALADGALHGGDAACAQVVGQRVGSRKAADEDGGRDDEKRDPDQRLGERRGSRAGRKPDEQAHRDEGAGELDLTPAQASRHSAQASPLVVGETSGLVRLDRVRDQNSIHRLPLLAFLGTEDDQAEPVVSTMRSNGMRASSAASLTPSSVPSKKHRTTSSWRINIEPRYRTRLPSALTLSALAPARLSSSARSPVLTPVQKHSAT